MNHPSSNNNDILNEVKSRIDIIEVISEHVVLKKSGRNFWGACPFHKEKTPSFSVNPDKNIFKCFGCGESGDSISFLMKINNQNFRETLLELARKYGIAIPEYTGNSQNTEAKTQILDLNKAAAEFFTNYLLSSDEAQKARDYLKKRNINENIIKQFSIGFSPNKYDSLSIHLKEKFKVSEELLDKSGLVVMKNNGNGYLDRFRNRVMIPIQDEKGNYIAFGARTLEEGQTPKYLNSPDTPVFSKSRNLYGLYQAKESIRLHDSVVIMEGYFDVITAHTHGITNAVAGLGTALTEQHIRLLARYTDSRRIYLSFDSDEAGINATTRGGEVIKSVFDGLGEIKHFDSSFNGTSDTENRSICEIRVIKTPSGKDPDEFIRAEGAEEFAAAMKKAPLLIDYEIDRIITTQGEINSPQKKAETVKFLIPLLIEIKNSIIRDEYILSISEKIGVNHVSLAQEVKKLLQRNRQAPQAFPTFVNKKIEKHIHAQKNLICLYFINSVNVTLSFINYSIKEVSFSDEILNLIKNKIESIIDNVSNSNELAKEILSKLEDNEAAKQIIVDILFSLEDKNSLNYGLKESDASVIQEFISDNIACIVKHNRLKEQNDLKSTYHQANTDELTSLQLQYKVREIIKSNQKRMEQ